MSKKKQKPEAYIHKLSPNSAYSYVLAIDPGRYCGIVLQSPLNGYATIFSALVDLGGFNEWWKIAENLRHDLADCVAMIRTFVEWSGNIQYST